MAKLRFFKKRTNGRREAGRVLGTFVLRVLGGLLIPLHAAQLPPHVSDYPVEQTKYPMEVENEFEEFVNQRFLQAKESGVEPFVDYWGDFLANPVGGRTQAASWMQLLIFGAEIEFEKFGDWKGGSLFISASDAAGSDLSLKIGNLFTVSQAYVMNTFALYDLYYKQRFFDGAFEFRIGRMSSGELFASLPVMGLPVSGAVNGNPTSLFTNAPFTSTASATWATYARVKPTAETYVQAGIFQANPRVGNPSYHGLDFSIRPGDGTLTMLELGWLPGAESTNESTNEETSDDKTGERKATLPVSASRLPGVYTIGAYFSRYTFSKFSGGTASHAYGFYAQVQQAVWRSAANSDHVVTLWGGVTYSPQTEIALLPVMGYGGVVWEGLIPGRDEDSALMNFSIGAFSSDYARQQARNGGGWATAETALEGSYIFQLTENLQIQPDVQWIIRPSGLRGIPNALVVGCQVGLVF